MSLSYLDHVNMRTTRLTEMVGFYTEVLGLRPGWRPPFKRNGAWLYCGEKDVVHIAEVTDERDGTAPRIDHFAFRAENLAGFLDKLRAMDVAYRITIVPELEVRQVNVLDPDGNRVEVAFAADEQADLSDYPAETAKPATQTV
ncbi:MAG TPA: VOC family protein [Kiloniellales bacterium]|nr:VOC family protein [Kiloniellales bacterium]